MAEYSYVDWGSGSPLDYEKFNKMMMNDIALKEQIDLMPRGVICWSKSDKTTLSKTSYDGTFHIVPGFSEIPFTVGRNRVIAVSVHAFYSEDTPTTLQFITRFDNQPSSVGWGTEAVYGGQSGLYTPFFFHKNDELVLSEGDHVVSLIYSSAESTINLDVGILLTIEDIGYNYNKITMYE